MKLTRRQLIKTLSYAGPVLATRPVSAFVSGNPVIAPGGLAATIESPQVANPASSPDLVVYGGTACGVMAAYSAARGTARRASGTRSPPGRHGYRRPFLH